MGYDQDLLSRIGRVFRWHDLSTGPGGCQETLKHQEVLGREII